MGRRTELILSQLYLTENDVKLGYEQGCITVKDAEGALVRSIPFSCVEGISVFGKGQLTTQLIRECLLSHISIGYYTEDGHYLGGLGGLNSVEPLRQKHQIALTDNLAFCRGWSRKVVKAKIANSLAFLRSMGQICVFSERDLNAMTHSLSAIADASSIEEILGFEGNAARGYFSCLSKLVLEEGFAFRGRSSRPPKDPFNSMLSYGYSLCYRNVIGALDRHGLHPYFAYLHKPKSGHAALASDLMEELRAPLVDAVVLDFANSGEVGVSDFKIEKEGAVYMDKQTMRKLTNRFSDAFADRQQYFSFYGDTKAYGFQVMLDKKIATLIEAIDREDPLLYAPFIWDDGYGMC